MTDSPYGYAGKILRVDLSEHRISEIDTLDYADRFLGGRGIATRLYWEEVAPDIDAFDPETGLLKKQALRELNLMDVAESAFLKIV